MIVSWGTLVILDVRVKRHSSRQERSKELGHGHTGANVVVRNEGAMGVSRADNRFSVFHDILSIPTDHRSLIMSHVFDAL
jgi:hypothetical protein